MSIGQRLKAARRAKKMTQVELAEAVGVSNGAIGNYETDVSSPNEPILIRLMEVLDIDANYLYQDYIRIEHEFSVDEKRLVTAYRGADEKIQRAALRMLEESAEENKPKKDTGSGRTA